MTDDKPKELAFEVATNDDYSAPWREWTQVINEEGDLIPAHSRGCIDGFEEVHVIDYEAFASIKHENDGLHEYYAKLFGKLTEAEAEIARLNDLSKDRLDDWKRIQDSERKLVEAEREIERLRESMTTRTDERVIIEKLTKENADHKLASERTAEIAVENVRLTKQNEELSALVKFRTEKWIFAENTIDARNDEIKKLECQYEERGMAMRDTGEMVRSLYVPYLIKIKEALKNPDDFEALAEVAKQIKLLEAYHPL